MKLRKIYRLLSALAVVIVLTPLLTSCRSSTIRESPVPDLYWPVFPSPLDEEGNPVCIYYPSEPSEDRQFQLYMNEKGIKYFPESRVIRIPYSEIRDCVIVPYSYWYKMLNYSAETEISVQQFETWKK